MELGISGEVLSAEAEAAEWHSELLQNDADQRKLFPTQVKMMMNVNSSGGLPNSTVAGESVGERKRKKERRGGGESNVSN